MSTFEGPLLEYPLISIDRFEKRNFGSTAFFLSHCHSDHMRGLNSSNFLYLLTVRCFSKVYVSEISRRLLWNNNTYQGIIPYLESLPLEQSTIIPVFDKNGNKKFDVMVTLIPAGHCPGSVMFLFEGPRGTVLYTGDFRLQHGSTRRIKALHHQDGRVKNIDSLYVDTTFCSEKSRFLPLRQHSMRALYNLIDPWLKEQDVNHVFLITPAQIGYEAVFRELYTKTGMKVHVSMDRYEMYKEIPEISSVVTTDITCTRIHCCMCTPPRYRQRPRLQFLPCAGSTAIMGRIRYIKLSVMLFTMYPSLQDIVEFDWKGNIYRVCFSTHSSLCEIIDMAEYLKPDRIYPNVVPDDLSPEQVMEPLLSALKRTAPPKESPPIIPPLGVLKSLNEGTSSSCKAGGNKDFVFSLPFSQENSECISTVTSKEDSDDERRNIPCSGVTEPTNKGKSTSSSGGINAPKKRNCSPGSNGKRKKRKVVETMVSLFETNISSNPGRTTSPVPNGGRTSEKTISTQNFKAIKPLDEISDDVFSSEIVDFPNDRTSSPSPGGRGRTDKQTDICKTDGMHTLEPVKAPTNSDISHDYDVPLWDYPPLMIDEACDPDALSSSAEQNSENLSQEGHDQTSESDRGNSSSLHLSEDDTELLSNTEKQPPPVTETCSPAGNFTDCNQKSPCPLYTSSGESDCNQKSPCVLCTSSAVSVSVCSTVSSVASSTREQIDLLREESMNLNSGSRSVMFQSNHGIPFSNSPSQSLISTNYAPLLSGANVLIRNSVTPFYPSCPNNLCSEFIAAPLKSPLYKATFEAPDQNPSEFASYATSGSSSLHFTSDESPVPGETVVRNEGMSQYQDVPLISKLPASESQHQDVPLITKLPASESQHQDVPLIAKLPASESQHQDVPLISKHSASESQHQDVPLISKHSASESQHQDVPLISKLPASESQHQDVPLISKLPASDMIASKAPHVVCQSPEHHAQLAGSDEDGISYVNEVLKEEHCSMKYSTICGSNHGTSSSLSISTDDSPVMEKSSGSSHSPSLLDGNTFVRNTSGVTSDKKHNLEFSPHQYDLVQVRDPVPIDLSVHGQKSSPFMLISTPAFPSHCEVKNSGSCEQDVYRTVSLGKQISNNSVGSGSASVTTSSENHMPLTDYNPSLGQCPADVRIANKTGEDYLGKICRRQCTFSEPSCSVSRNDNLGRHPGIVPTFPSQSEEKITENYTSCQDLDSPSPKEQTVENSVSTSVCNCTPTNNSNSDSSSSSVPPVFYKDQSSGPLLHLSDKMTEIDKTVHSPVLGDEKAEQPVLDQDPSGSSQKISEHYLSSPTAHKKQKSCDSVSTRHSDFTSANYCIPNGGSLSSPELFCDHNSSPELKFPSRDNRIMANSPSFENTKQKASSDTEEQPVQSLGTDGMSHSPDTFLYPVSYPSGDVQNPSASAGPSCFAFISENQVISFAGNKSDGENNAGDLDPGYANEDIDINCQIDEEKLSSSADLDSSQPMLFLTPSSGEQSFNSAAVVDLAESEISPPQGRNNSPFLSSYQESSSSDTESIASDGTEEYNSFDELIPERHPSPLLEDSSPMVSKHGIVTIDEPLVITVSSDDDDVTSGILLNSSGENVSSSPFSESLVAGVHCQQNTEVESKPEIIVVDLSLDSE